MRVWAKVTTKFTGLHHYPAAPDNVAFLRDKHRHVFHVTVWVEQFHDNRDVEYLTFLEFLEGEVKKVQEQLRTDPTLSCEQMAKTLAWVSSDGRHVRVEVLEDGENGALVEL